MDKLPFEQKKQGDKVVRTFSESVDNTELKWHVDNEDRLVTPLHKTDWMIQMDNELPKKLVENQGLIIPKGIYHRVIKGNGDLRVSIKFI